MSFRFGEVDKVHFRTGRCYRVSDQWFFSTRENLHIGPFTSRDEVDVELFFYLKCLDTVPSELGLPASFKSIKGKR